MARPSKGKGRRTRKPVTKRISKSPQYDAQREEVYAWEGGFRGTKNIPAPTRIFNGMLRTICAQYEVPVPRILPRMPKAYRHFAAIAALDEGYLAFSPGWNSLPVLCHELAHWICDQYGYRHVYHGPRWLGVYLYLMDATYVLPLSASKPSARAAGLKFRDPITASSPSTLKKYLK